MFKIDGNTRYLVSHIIGGQGAKGGYTFITIDDEIRRGQRYPDKLKINVWGENLASNIKKGDSIAISGIKEMGEVAQEDKTKQGVWYRNLTIVCSPEQIVCNGVASKKEEPAWLPKESEEQKPTQNSIDDLPF